eukprot:CAMPEP_0168187266 /NCGR_PEP_ID=MMETSP0139_2-20121125/14932_1 /TAXON_ID=44445 /ORGANISM="Pseudo-nitzschia australis, Strain 10249 10 AB" /LENGTH=337 /DNA_ID=CAMNT_0008109445 /DNA_START=94 /DNA_END=1107 /DNA_ORIENTATION=-
MALNNSTSFLLRAASRRCASVRSARVQMQQQATSTSATATTAARSFWSTTPASVNEEEVRSLFYKWNDALATLDSGKVADRYAENALLLPTVSDTPRNSPEAIKDYFDHFLKSQPQGEILESFVQIGDCGRWAQDNGIYEFTLAGADGAKVKGRYTFVYTKSNDGGDDDEWKIAHHHSSQMPEEITPKKQAGAEYVDAKETRALFDLWNDALATLDPKKVAARYSKDAILLPTVSDTPRTTPAAIEDYFAHFLKSEPQGVIQEEGSVTISGEPNWAKDAGIYEFTMGATGDKVKGRYSFVYVFEDGEWKIAHHHSSVMPEGVLAAGAKLEAVKKAIE